MGDMRVGTKCCDLGLRVGMSLLLDTLSSFGVIIKFTIRTTHDGSMMVL